MTARLLEPGVRVHRWVVVEEAEPSLTRSGRPRRRWFCRCRCGAEKIVLQQGLSLALRAETGGSRSCGCLAHERATKHANIVHGRPTSEYAAWIAAKKRCGNPRNASYRNYGGRGIRMCPEWCGSFDAFLRDMGQKPDPTFSLDRIDPNGHYEPGNCRWAPPLVQARNKRNTRWYVFRGERLILAEVAARLGVTRDEARALERRGLLPAIQVGAAADEHPSMVIDLNDVVPLRRPYMLPRIAEAA